MTKMHYLKITHALQYTNKEVPPLTFVDKFQMVRQIMYEFNKLYKQEYLSLWMNCVNKSMNSWLKKYSPGFISFPQKLHPFGNKYHLISAGDNGHVIMWRIKLVEGKDCSKLLNRKWAFELQWECKYPNAPTVMRLLEITEPIHWTGKIVTGDSGFCVTRGVLALREIGMSG